MHDVTTCIEFYTRPTWECFFIAQVPHNRMSAETQHPTIDQLYGAAGAASDVLPTGPLCICLERTYVHFGEVQGTVNQKMLILLHEESVVTWL